ncbi:MAG TPA: hypothetical protein VJ302_27665 [Blastocatellia bacterium]|nr:hypothetical protein [Blastocatellia bacterium]
MKNYEEKYEDLSIEDLEVKLLEISNQRDALRDEALAISQIRDRKVTLQKAQEKVAAMSPAEREALFQVISA